MKFQLVILSTQHRYFGKVILRHDFKIKTLRRGLTYLRPISKFYDQAHIFIKESATTPYIPLISILIFFITKYSEIFLEVDLRFEI